MPEYRRFIAYFYEYIDGKKQKNAGFAKVELRNGMWRILFRVTASSQPEPPVQVYGFVREKGYLLGLLMGTMRPGCEMMEEWGYRAELPVWKGKYRLEDLSGIWIQSGDDRSYITVWDDEPVDAESFVLELPETEKEPEKGMQKEPEKESEKESEEEPDKGREEELGKEWEKELKKESEKEREKGLERAREKESEKETDRGMEKEPEKELEKGTDKWPEKEPDGEPGKETGRRTNGEYGGGMEAAEWNGGSPGERSDGSGNSGSMEMTAMAGEAVSGRQDSGVPEMGMIISGAAERQEDNQSANNKTDEGIDQASVSDPVNKIIMEEWVEEGQEKEERRKTEKEQGKETGQEMERRQGTESCQGIENRQEREKNQNVENCQNMEKGQEMEGDQEMRAGRASVQGQASMRGYAPAQRRRPVRSCPSAQSRISSKEQLWQELSRARTHFQPFEDTEFTKCIQIMPCDIMRLQQAGVQVGRSSFLLHGFYQYRHLLLGTTREGDWIIGVPGIQNNQERYMAQMFGFNQFKTARRPDRNRQFGYWCRSLGSVPEEIDEGTKAEDQQEQAQEQKQE